MISTKEIVFVDRDITDIEALLAGLRIDVEAVILSPAESALAQIARSVACRSFEAVHIVAHGRSGEVSFSSGALTLETLNEHGSHLDAIGRALGDGGSLLLWSCETGKGARGSAFVRELSIETGVAVAASSDLVGAAACGGQWELGTQSGLAFCNVPLTAQGVATYAGVMTNNDPVVDLTDVTGEVTELSTPTGNVTDSGTIGFSDDDLVDIHSLGPVTPSDGALGTLTASVTADTTGVGLGGVVTWEYSVAAAAVEYLAAGETKVGSFSFDVLDDQGGVVTRTINVTITGTNDVPVAVADTDSGTQGDVLTGSVAQNDSDADDGAVLTYSLNAPVAGLTLDSDGGYSFDAADAAYQHLAQGATSNVVANYTVTDEHGAVSTSSLTITLTGTNDVPTLSIIAAPVATVGAERQATITLDDLKAQGNEVDVDGTVDAFVVKAVTSGSLLIGTSANSATAWQAGSNDTVDGTHQAFWTDAGNATGTLNAFTVVALDNDGMESSLPAVQATVAVVPVTTYNWSALTDGQSIAFNPNVDLLAIDDPAISAADMVVTFAAGSVTFASAGRSITLQSDVKTITTVNLTFADGSRCLIGDNTTATTNDDDANTLIGGTGADKLTGLGGDDSLSGGDGNDHFVLAHGADVFGNDTADGGAGSDTADYSGAAAGIAVDLAGQYGLNGAGDTETLLSIENVMGSSFNDYLSGTTGDNIFKGGVGSDILIGLAGNDTADYSSDVAGVIVDLAAHYGVDGQGDTDYLVSIENVIGSTFNDFLSGSAADNTFKGGAGNDIFVGLGGRDTIDLSSATAGAAVDLANHYAIDGLGGVDYFEGIENITGSALDDYLSGDNGDNVFNGGAGSDMIVGLGGGDSVDYSSATFGVAVDLAGQYGVDGLGGTDFLESVENVFGSAFSDYLSGTTGDNLFKGGAGSDILVGLAGNDTVDYSGDAAGVIVDLAAQYGVDGQGDTDYLVSIENVLGSAFDDYLSGSTADNIFKGGAGDDVFVGDAGIDTADYSTATSGAIVNLEGSFALDGQGGTDFMVGIENIIGSPFADALVGDGNANCIDGAEGDDFLIGNAGADNFAFTTGGGFDTIVDFTNAGGDKISLQSNLNGSGITTEAQALAHTFDFGGNAVIDLGGGNSVTLLGVTTASLAASDFIIA